MNWFERILIFSTIIVLGGITAWMQSDLLDESTNEQQLITDNHDPDYYIENFTAVGMDIDGNRQYVLEAERMVHFPDDDTSLLDNNMNLNAVRHISILKPDGFLPMVMKSY